MREKSQIRVGDVLNQFESEAFGVIEELIEADKRRVGSKEGNKAKAQLGSPGKGEP